MVSKNKKIDFLSKPTTERLRREINNICDSYSNSWDVIAELCQNSVDSINQYNIEFEKSAKKEHKIDVEINSKERSIRIFDTGIGFSKEDFEDLLSPHGTNKTGKLGIIGEKGVGLTYTIFKCNYYSIETKSTEVYIEGFVKNASLWKNGMKSHIPLFNVATWEEGDFERNETYTNIILKDVEKNDIEEEEEIFSQNIEILEYILRTKTAIGHLKQIFQETALDIKVTLLYIDHTGKKEEKIIRPVYMLPEESISASNVINFEDFLAKAAMLDDKQKSRELQAKSLIRIGYKTRGNRKINYHVFFAHSRQIWKEISEKNNLVRTSTEGERNYLYESGIFVGSKGMPTGIKIDPPITGYSGYWGNFHIIIEDDNITFDLGRKTVPSRLTGIFREIAKSLFWEFIPFLRYVTVDPPIVPPTTIQVYEKSKTFEELKRLPDLKTDKICYLKNPDSQEAGVSAIFHELVGAGILKGYSSLRSGYKQTYDLWSIYKINKEFIGSKYHLIESKHDYIEVPTIIEFKFSAEDILKDFEDNIKYFIDLDLLVCWDLDETKFSRYNVKVELLKKEDIFFYGSNYRLIWPGSYNLGNAGEKPVLALRKFIENYSNST